MKNEFSEAEEIEETQSWKKLFKILWEMNPC